MIETKLCNSLSGIELPLLTITNPFISELNKKVIIIMARIHPGESNSS